MQNGNDYEDNLKNYRDDNCINQGSWLKVSEIQFYLWQNEEIKGQITKVPHFISRRAKSCGKPRFNRLPLQN